MLWPCLFVFTALAALVPAESNCFFQTTQKCRRAITSQAAESYDPCSILPKFVECLENGLKECQLNTTLYPTEELKQLEKVVSDICEPGTELNKVFNENLECLASFAMVSLEPCIKPITKAIESLGVPTAGEDYGKKVAEVFCKLSPGAVECVKNVKENCNGAEKVFIALFDPLLKLLEVDCSSLASATNATLLTSSPPPFIANGSLFMEYELYSSNVSSFPRNASMFPSNASLFPPNSSVPTWKAPTLIGQLFFVILSLIVLF